MNALINRNTRQMIMEGVDIKSTFLGRLTGYTLRTGIGSTSMLFMDTRRVHTWGMLFPLDLYFFDASLIFLGSSRAVQPMRFPRSPKGTRHILEVPCHDSNPPLGLETGEQVSILWRAG